jgi:hypothetical protein
VFVVAGVAGFLYHAIRFNAQDPIDDKAVWVLFLRLLAVAAGVAMLRGRNWARWLGLAWIAYQGFESAWRSWSQTVTHIVLLAGFAYVLFQPGAAAYFTRRFARRDSRQPAPR